MNDDTWTKDYESAKDLANEILAAIQDRNVNHPEGGPEASRLTATARRKLGTLGAAIDTLRTSLESALCAHLTENEKNRRRDLAGALRSRREQMLQALKRDPQLRGNAASRSRQDLLSNGSTAKPINSRETDATAELDNTGLLSMQQQVMQEQDGNLLLLERTVQGTKHIALQINEETSLQNRLLEEFDHEVDATSSRLRAVQRKAQIILRRSGSLRTQVLMCLLLVILVVVILVAFKIAIHL